MRVFLTHWMQFFFLLQIMENHIIHRSQVESSFELSNNWTAICYAETFCRQTICLSTGEATELQRFILCSQTRTRYWCNSPLNGILHLHNFINLEPRQSCSTTTTFTFHSLKILQLCILYLHFQNLLWELISKVDGLEILLLRSNIYCASHNWIIKDPIAYIYI